MSSSTWRPNTTSMSFNKNYKPFPSNPPRTSTNYSQFSTNRGSINNLRNSRQFPSTPNPNPPSRSTKLITWFIDWLINRMFSNYPIWIQSIITAIIGFIAYFLYDYASNIQTISYYLVYKTISIILFLISVSCLYLLFLNFNNNKSKSSTNNNLRNNIGNISNNPYSISSQQPFNKSNPTTNTSKNKLRNNKRDDLYFTNKSMINRVSSTVLKSTEPKYDFNSSPNKISSLDPNKIVTQKNLSNFLKNQKQKQQTINEYDILGRASSSILTTPSMNNINNINKTPIGKTFGSMRMTPAINNKFESSTRQSLNLWNTPNKLLNNTNQGSAGIATPESSNMDVSMISYDKIDTEPFQADFSVIQPSTNQASVAWNVSGFGGFNSNPMNMSTVVEPGTPAGKGGIGIGNGINNGYDYDGMYNDINLRGDNIGEILKNTTVTNIGSNNNGNNGNNKLRVTKAPISPFSRKRGDGMSSSMNDMNKNKNRMSNIVFTSMGVKKSQFAAYYMEKSINLYFNLRIDSLIVNWAESMRWWLSEMIKNRNNEIYSNNLDINKIFNLLSNKYNLKQQLSEFVTYGQRERFILENENQLGNVAKQENNPSIMHIIQKRKHLKDCIDFICINYRNYSGGYNNLGDVSEYVYQRISELSSTNNLQLYKWNAGNTQWRHGIFPSDSHLLMTLFCRYMDDAMCPAIKFSEKHYIQISYRDIKKIDKLYKKFKDIAIICVSDMKTTSNYKNNSQNFKSKYNNNDEKDIMDQDSLPYFFIAFNKKKFEKQIKHFGKSIGGIQKPKHFLYNTWNNFSNNLNNSFNNYFYNNNNNNMNNKNQNNINMNREGKEEEDNENDLYYNRRNKKNIHSNSVGTWFPQPGKDNLIHTITLFALFIHRYCDDKLTGIALKDQGCTLLQPILR